MGEYRFSSLLKQNKKAKICFVIYIAGKRKIFFIYLWSDYMGKKKKSLPIVLLAPVTGAGRPDRQHLDQARCDRPLRQSAPPGGQHRRRSPSDGGVVSLANRTSEADGQIPGKEIIVIPISDIFRWYSAKMNEQQIGCRLPRIGAPWNLVQVLNPSVCVFLCFM